MDTNLETEVTSDAAVEAKLEAAFSKRYGSDEQEAPKPTERAESEEVEDEEPDQTEEAEPEEEFEDYDLDGEVLKVRKTTAEKIKAAMEAGKKVRDLHAGFTQKTQEIAEERRRVAEQQQSLQMMEQFRQVQFDVMVGIKLDQDRLAQYEQIDWQALAQQDPARALALQADWQKTRQSLEAKQRESHQMQQQMAQLHAQQQQKMVEEGAKRLAEKLPNWGRDAQEEILRSTREYGFHDWELAHVNDPRLVHLLHDLAVLKKASASRDQVLAKRVSNAKPMPATASRGVQKSQQSVRDEDLRSRMRKTGATRDVEDFLAHRFANAKRK